MSRISKLLIVLYAFFLISLGSQNTLTNAVSSNTGGCIEEGIFMWIRPSGDIDLMILFLGDAPIDSSDFENDPSFIDLSIIGAHSLTPEVKNTMIFVGLNNTIVSIPEGKLKADILKAKFEKLLDLTIPYSSNFSSGDRALYVYSVEDCPIQKFRDVLLEHKPTQGFGNLVTPALISNINSIFFRLRREDGNLLGWEYSVSVGYYDYFDMSIGQEYTISLKELTGFSDAIQSSPLCSNSTLSIAIAQVNKDYKLMSIETTPTMEKTENEVGGTTNIVFQKTITGSSAADLSIHFKIVSPSYIDPTTIILIIGLVVAIVAILGIVGFTIRRKRRAKEDRKYFWSPLN